MNTPKRFISLVLASFLVVIWGGLGAGGGPTWAADPELRNPESGIVVGGVDGLQLEPAIWDDRTLFDSWAIPSPDAAITTEEALPPGTATPPESTVDPALATDELATDDLTTDARIDALITDESTESTADGAGTAEVAPQIAAPQIDEATEVDAADTASEEPGAETWVDRDELGRPSDLEVILRGLDPEEAERSRLLIQADRLYRAGDRAAARALYRQAKDAAWLAEEVSDEPLIPLMDAEDLPPAGRVYWREVQAGLESEFPNRVLVPLALLLKEYPEFLPAQLLHARYLLTQDRAAEAAAILEESAIRYPYHPEVLKAQVEVKMAREQWIEAAIAANQFAILNPEHPDAEAMSQLSAANLDRFRGHMNQTLTRNLVTNIITGAAGYILTGGLLGPFTAVNSGILLMQGEQGLGQQAAAQVMRRLPIVDDPEIRAYINDMGHRLAALSGRTEFDYSFEVIMDDSLNAFALPGGKIFINAGAITRSRSEAELAGLLGHEISHAVLSHGFQLVTQGNLTASLASFIPVPEVASIAANLIVASYSRDMERQADILGTKLLATERYAADGLHNLMATLEQEYGNRGVTWFASHPNPRDRIAYLRQLVDQGGLNRYTYEGVETHLKMRHKMTQLLNAYKLEQAEEAENRVPPAP